MLLQSSRITLPAVAASSIWRAHPRVPCLHTSPTSSIRCSSSSTSSRRLIVCLAGRPSSRAGSSSNAGNTRHKHNSSPSRSSSSSNGPAKPQDQGRGKAASRGKGQQQQQTSQRVAPGNSSSSSSSRGSSGYPGSDSRGSSSAPASSKASSSSSSGFTSAPKSSPLPASAQVLVVGGGAAGLTAAHFAAQAGAKVTVLERTREAGKKILMSGGSRCNVLPLAVDPSIDFFTASSRGALRAVLASWALQDCKEWLSVDVGLRLQLEQETNKWFPASNSGREVRDRLVEACQQLGVRFVYNASVEALQPPETAAAAADVAGSLQEAQRPSSSSSSSWSVVLASGAKVSAERVIFSTGGRSFPAVGTDGTGLNLLQGCGHSLVAQYAALTPLKGAHPGGQQLAGLTLPSVRLSCTTPNKHSKVAAVAQRGGLLFTHKGYSGPAVLDLSHWLVRELDQQQQPAAMPKLLVDWTGEGAEVWQQRLAAASGAATVESVLRKAGVKERLAAALAVEVGVQGRQMSQLKKAERQALLIALTAWPLPISSHEGYKKAEVTGGGVPLEQVDCKTMESRLLPGLHVCGEVLDVFGRIGGFNFLWAWVTGRLAGLGAAAQLGLPTAAAAATASQSRARR